MYSKLIDVASLCHAIKDNKNLIKYPINDIENEKYVSPRPWTCFNVNETTNPAKGSQSWGKKDSFKDTRKQIKYVSGWDDIQAINVVKAQSTVTCQNLLRLIRSQHLMNDAIYSLFYSSINIQLQYISLGTR